MSSDAEKKCGWDSENDCNDCQYEGCPNYGASLEESDQEDKSSRGVGGLEAQAVTLADLQSKVYWLHQDGECVFDTEKEAEDFLKGFEKQYISLAEHQKQIQKLKKDKDWLEEQINQFEREIPALIEKNEVLEARLERAKQLAKDFPSYDKALDDIGGMYPYEVQMWGTELDEWLEKLLGVLEGKEKAREAQG